MGLRGILGLNRGKDRSGYAVTCVQFRPTERLAREAIACEGCGDVILEPRVNQRFHNTACRVRTWKREREGSMEMLTKRHTRAMLDGGVALSLVLRAAGYTVADVARRVNKGRREEVSYPQVWKVVAGHSRSGQKTTRVRGVVAEMLGLSVGHVWKE